MENIIIILFIIIIIYLICMKSKNNEVESFINYNSNCQEWANNGECRKNPRYMLNNCSDNCYNEIKIKEFINIVEDLAKKEQSIIDKRNYLLREINKLMSTPSSKFKKLEKTNCVHARIPAPGTSGADYKYLGKFDTYDQCAESPNIDQNAQAITHHDATAGSWSNQCFSINDTNTAVPNENATCGIRVQTNQCPTNGSVSCPTGTLACSAQPGYCYDKAKDQMVSTYYVPDYDKCPTDPTSTKTNLAYQIGGVNVWSRQGGYDKKLCPEIFDFLNQFEKMIDSNTNDLKSIYSEVNLVAKNYSAFTGMDININLEEFFRGEVKPGIPELLYYLRNENKWINN
jgi:hypothetical protein